MDSDRASSCSDRPSLLCLDITRDGSTEAGEVASCVAILINSVVGTAPDRRFGPGYEQSLGKLCASCNELAE